MAAYNRIFGVNAENGYTDEHYLDEVEGTKEETLFLATCTGKEVLDLLAKKNQAGSSVLVTAAVGPSGTTYGTTDYANSAMFASGRRVFLCLNDNVQDSSINRAGTNAKDESEKIRTDANDRNMVVLELDPLLETKFAYGMLSFMLAKIFFSVCAISPFALFLFTKQQAVAHYASDREMKEMLVAQPVGVAEVKRNNSLTGA